MDKKERDKMSESRCEMCRTIPLHPMKKCCFNCGRAWTDCDVWHTCGEDCPGWEGKGMNQIGYEERKTVYASAIEKCGMDAQSCMAIEEMSELTKELCKARRGKNDPDALADEIADVTIMLEQLRMMFGVNDLVCQHMDMKIDRLKKRLGYRENVR